LRADRYSFRPPLERWHEWQKPCQKGVSDGSFLFFIKGKTKNQQNMTFLDGIHLYVALFFLEFTEVDVDL
jgi:hypothetical protein